MTGHRLPNLTALRCFDAVARHLSFTLAARELGVTQAAVSRQIKALEIELSARLFARGAGRNELTSAGEILFAASSGAFEAIEVAVGKITGSGAREILNVSVAPFFSAVWLTPRLMSFIGGTPASTSASIIPTGRPTTSASRSISASTGRWRMAGRGQGQGPRRGPDAGHEPRSRGTLGPLTDPSQLLSATLLYEFAAADWSRWFAAEGLAIGAGPAMLRLNDSHALRRAALDGHGVALFFAELIGDDLARGFSSPAPVAVLRCARPT